MIPGQDNILWQIKYDLLYFKEIIFDSIKSLYKYVIRDKRIETIFDQNVTEDEFRELFPYYKNKEVYLSFCEHEYYMEIAKLYHHRKKYGKMRLYAMKVKNINLRHSFFRTVFHH